MSVYLNDVYEKAKSHNYLELLAGKAGINNLVSWVYHLEDEQDIPEMDKNMLVITSGCQLKNDEEFLRYTEQLIDNHCCGMIVRIGGYWATVPDQVVDYCDRRNFPLFSMQWGTSAMVFQKEFCQLITLKNISENQINDAFYAILSHPESFHEYTSIFELGGVTVHDSYCCVMIQAERTGADDNDSDWKRKMHHRLRQLGTCFMFEYLGNDIAIIGCDNISQIKTLLTDFNRSPYIKNGSVKLSFGVGCIVQGLTNLHKSFKCARAALKKALLDKTELEVFGNIGFYQILLSCENTEILNSYCCQYLQKIEDYDKRHSTELLKTLKLYLKYESSVNRVAHEMYTHRNTINSRIAKIKELTGEDFETAEEKFSYQLAFYIYQMQNSGE